jgi:amino acid transporter
MELSRKPGKVLSVFTLAMINVIAIDSIRNLPMNASVGYSIVFYYILGSLLFFIPCILITAELATHYPKTGGSYVWTRHAFGARMGFVTIWLLWIYNVVWFPTILSFIAATAVYWFAPELANSKAFLVPTVVIVFILASLVNAFGMKVASSISIIGAIVGTILPMILIIGFGIAWVSGVHPLAIQPTIAAFFPSIDNLNNLSLVVVVLFSLVGIEMSAVHAGEVKNPQRDFPRALIISGVIIVVSLILSSLALAMVIPAHTLNIISGIDQVFATLLAPYHLQWLLPVTVIMILVGAFAGMAAWVLGPAKGFMVAAAEGGMPRWMCAQNGKGAPVGVLVVQAIVVFLIALLFLCFDSVSTTYWILSVLTGQLSLIYYVILFAAAIRLRYITPIKTGAYRIPGGKTGVWIVGLVGVLSCIVAILLGFLPPSTVTVDHVLGYEAILIGGIIVFAGIPWLLYRKPH